MTDPNTPPRGGENTEPETAGAETAAPGTDEPSFPAVDPTEADAAVAPEAMAGAEPSAEPVAAPVEPAEPAADSPVASPAASPEAARAFEAPEASTRAFDSAEIPTEAPSQGSTDAPRAAAYAPDRPLHPEGPASSTVPPLSPPSSSPAAASTGALPDDSALRAAEAARSGESTDPATAAYPAPAFLPAASDTGEVGDTRIVASNGARSSTAWTPPPAPTSPPEYGTPTAATPTPYALAGSASPAAPPTSTTPLTNLGTSPAASLGFTDGIAGGDDGFTPEELAQRRAFRDEMAFRQRQEFAGINFGSAFFGWLAATGLASILYLIAGGIAVASGLATKSVLTGGSDKVTSLGSVFTTQSLQITALVVFLVVLFLSYFVGGFVASRMARFSGLKQGLAVWLWGLVMSIIAAVVIVVIVSQTSSLSSVQSTTSGLSTSDYTSVPALISFALIAVLSIGGALLGGLAGQGFHRRVDRFGFDEV
jgi:hypothetical protein